MVKSPSSDLPSDKRSDDEDEMETDKVHLLIYLFCFFLCAVPKMNILNFQFESKLLTCSNDQDLAPMKLPNRRSRADRLVVKEEDDEEDDEEENYDEECEQEASSSGEQEVKEREIKKEIKKEKKEESFEIKDTKELKEKKETKSLEVVHKQEESKEKVIYILLIDNYTKNRIVI